MAKIDVYGLTETELDELKQQAQQRLGKNSISLLAKTLLLSSLPSKIQSEHSGEINAAEKEPAKYRLSIRLPSHDYHYLKKAAQQQAMTPNTFAVCILRNYIDRHPALSNKEAEALYQSNYQLLRIGRNLNQIARQLNIGETGSITSGEIQQLREVIEKHTEKVQDVLLANKRRFE